jgi:hypothetical protein
MNLYLGLVHYPIKNKLGELVTTSVTNLDIHDISRSCRTFGVKKYFLITPLNLQRELVDSILGHWEQDHANAYNPDRQDALNVAMAVDSFETALKEIEKLEGKKPFVVATGANFETSDGDVSQLTKKAEIGKMPCFLLFGTGWGLHPEILQKVDYKLAPIVSTNSDGYNHLSVRSAVAIYLDRFFGNR